MNSENTPNEKPESPDTAPESPDTAPEPPDTAPEPPDTGLLDVLIVPEDPTRKIAPRAAEALLRNLCTLRIGRPVDEAVADEWAEIYLAADASSHTPFIAGGYTDTQPVFLEAVMRLGTKPVPIPFGLQDVAVTFYIEFRGCRYPDVGGPFRKRFQEMLYARPKVFTRKHVALPPHAEVPEGEEPKDRHKKKRDSGGLAGTRTEEW